MSHFDKLRDSRSIPVSKGKWFQLKLINFASSLVMLVRMPLEKYECDLYVLMCFLSEVLLEQNVLL